MFKGIFKVLAVIITLWITPAFAGTATFYYSDGPWHGSVIDSETKAPIEGAVVLAVWQKVYATLTGDSSYFLDAVEVLTDKDGNFLIPKFSAFNINPTARIEGPTFMIYKPVYAVFPGFGAQYFDKYFPENLKVDTYTLAELFKKGAIIELPKLKTWIERIESHELADTFRSAYNISDIKVPTFRQFLEKEDNYLKPMYKYNREKLKIPVGEFPK